MFLSPIVYPKKSEHKTEETFLYQKVSSGNKFKKNNNFNTILDKVTLLQWLLK